MLTARDRRALASWERALETPPEKENGPDEICARPGRYGCGNCEGCDAWADAAIDYEREG